MSHEVKTDERRSLDERKSESDLITEQLNFHKVFKILGESKQSTSYKDFSKVWKLERSRFFKYFKDSLIEREFFLKYVGKTFSRWRFTTFFCLLGTALFMVIDYFNRHLFRNQDVNLWITTGIRYTILIFASCGLVLFYSRPVKKSTFLAEFNMFLMNVFVVLGISAVSKTTLLENEFPIGIHGELSIILVGKLECLQKLQRLVEIEEFLVFEKRSFSKKPHAINRILQSWNKRYPCIYFDDPSVWNNIFINREFILPKMLSMLKETDKKFFSSDGEEGVSSLSSQSEEISKSNDAGFTFNMSLVEIGKLCESENSPLTRVKQIFLERVDANIKEHLSNFNLQWSKSAQINGNYTVASLCLKGSRQKGRKNIDQNYDYRFRKGVSRVIMMRGERATEMGDVNKLFKMLLDEIKGNQQRFQGGVFSLKMQLVSVDSLFSFYQKMRSLELNELLGTTRTECLNRAYKIINGVCVDLDGEDGSNLKKQSIKTKAFYKFAFFANRIMQNKEVEMMGISNSDFYVATTKFSLLSIRNNHKYCLELFPIVLEIIKETKKARKIFSKLVDGIPSWVLLYWYSQMLPCLRSGEGKAVVKTLRRITDDYLFGVNYMVNIVKDDILKEGLPPSLEDEFQVIIHKCLSTENKSYAKFIHQLELTLHPHLQFNDMFNEITALGWKATSKENWKDILRHTWQKNFDELFDKKKYAKGQLREKFALEFGSTVKRLIGRNFENVRSISDFNEKLKELSETRDRRGQCTPRNYCKNVRGNSSLKVVSDDLRYFKERIGSNIEIPGQYDFLSKKPDVSSHTMIIGMHEKILIMGSLRVPKRMSFIGDGDEVDENEEPFRDGSYRWHKKMNVVTLMSTTKFKVMVHWNCHLECKCPCNIVVKV